MALITTRISAISALRSRGSLVHPGSGARLLGTVLTERFIDASAERPENTRAAFEEALRGLAGLPTLPEYGEGSAGKYCQPPQ